jgi:hypothetical protein
MATTPAGAAYVTHGTKYHTDADCPLMVGGEGLWQNASDADDYPWHPGTYRITDRSPEYAAMRGKLPCLHCVPAELRVFPPLYGQTFGHEPVSNDADYWGETVDDPPVCARCRRRVRRWTSYSNGYDERAGVIWEEGWISYEVAVLWPCTSAIVLGLVERPALTAAGRTGSEVKAQ